MKYNNTFIIASRAYFQQLSSHSLAQNDCGHISNISADHVRRGKVWMLSIDAVAVADSENPLSACHAQYATLSKRNSKVPPRIDPHIETLLQGGYHYINIT